MNILSGGTLQVFNFLGIGPFHERRICPPTYCMPFETLHIHKRFCFLKRIHVVYKEARFILANQKICPEELRVPETESKR